MQLSNFTILYEQNTTNPLKDEDNWAYLYVSCGYHRIFYAMIEKVILPMKSQETYIYYSANSLKLTCTIYYNIIQVLWDGWVR